MSALDRGYGALVRHPWLMLIPLLRDVTELGLNYAGLPAFPLRTEVTLIGQPAASGGRGFLPSALPTITDLRLPLAPAAQTPLVQASPLAALAALLLIPALDGLAIALFLGLIGDALAGRPLSWRQALRNWPLFTALDLAGRLAIVALPVELIFIGAFFALLVFPALPFAIGVLNLPLLEAFGTAPVLFWSRFWRWLGYCLLTGLLTALATGLWSLLGAGSFAALLVYPALATVLVGGAAAIALEDEPVDPPTGRAPAWALPVVAVAAVGLAWAGAACVDAWKGFQPTRQAVLEQPPNGPFPFQFGQENRIIVKVLPDGDGELVLARVNENGLSVSAVKRNRFGWKHVWTEYIPAEPGALAPAVTLVRVDPLRAGWVIAGRIFDPRVAYLQDDARRYEINPGEPLFLLRVDQEPRGQMRAMDAGGQPVPNREVKRP